MGRKQTRPTYSATADFLMMNGARCAPLYVDLQGYGVFVMAKQNAPGTIRHPLSLVTCALSLVFGVLATQNPGPWPWWPYLAAALAVVSVLGGLWLTRGRTTPKGRDRPSQSAKAAPHQETHGDQSPVVNDTKGDVNISYGASPEGKKK